MKYYVSAPAADVKNTKGYSVLHVPSHPLPKTPDVTKNLMDPAAACEETSAAPNEHVVPDRLPLMPPDAATTVHKAMAAMIDEDAHATTDMKKDSAAPAEH
mmetsp:Transcript_50679/g.61110  ORF Transcript_50679/g.61110 Transcript_50679/m.61110 type:complete len:101 (-) Transcript_50679:969-1271(-)